MTVETNKPRIIKEHVGGSADYPTSKIGEALLKQKALTSLPTTFPDSLSKLNGKLSELLSIGTNIKETKKPKDVQFESPTALSGYETPSESEVLDEDFFPTPPPRESLTTKQDRKQPATHSGRSDNDSTENDEVESYENILKKLIRIKTRSLRNTTRGIEDDTNTLIYLRDIGIITEDDTENSIITSKMESAITQIDGHIAQLRTPDGKNKNPALAQI